jgi:hypothetical protein
MAAGRRDRLRLSRLVLAALLAAAALVALGVAWSAGELTRRMDETAARDAAAMLALAVDGQRDVVLTTTIDYAHWTEAHRATEAGDIGWLTENVGAGVFATGTMDLAVVLSGASGLHVGWSSLAGGETIHDLLEPEALHAAARAFAEAQGRATTLFLRCRDALWLAGVSRIEPQTMAVGTGRDDHFLVLGQLFDEAEVAALGARLLLRDLRLTDCLLYTSPSPRDRG